MQEATLDKPSIKFRPSLHVLGLVLGSDKFSCQNFKQIGTKKEMSISLSKIGKGFYQKEVKRQS